MATAIIEPGKIYEAMGNIQAQIPNLQKNGIGPQTQGSYKFLAVDDVLAAIRPLLNEHKVFITSTLLDKEISYDYGVIPDGGRVGKKNTHVFLTYEYRFTSTEDGSYVTTTVVGEGIDSQDKAVRKATTSAQKILLINTFSLVTGEPDLHDAGDGGADTQRDTQAAPANRAQQAVTKARAAAPKAPDRGKADALRKEIQDNFLAEEKVSRDDVNALATKHAAALKLAKGHEDVLTKVLEDLNAGVVA